MKTIPAILYSAFFLFALISCQKKEKTLGTTLQKSVEWIWSQQSSDGGWHSKTHAVLRDGKVITPYILFYLLQLPGENNPARKEAIEKAIGFITNEMRSSIDSHSITLTDYPNYSAAFSMRVLHKLDRDTSLQRIIADYLIGQQFLEHRGFLPDSLAYGGWGYGEPNLKMGQHGHEDISHTRRVVEALVDAGYFEEKEKSEEAVLLFLKGVQRSHDDLRLYEGCTSRLQLPYDGGFVASLVTLETNKSQPVTIENAGYHYPSYATATCDGFLTMFAMKLDDNYPLYSDAKKWLLKHQQIATIDGLDKEDPEQWAEIMHYYHLAVRSEAMSIIDPEGKWQEAISTILIREQLENGSYVNPIGGVNKEDDPLMATIFAIQAAGNCILRGLSNNPGARN